MSLLCYTHVIVKPCCVTYFISEIVSDDDSTLDNIQWLKNNNKPWSKLLELWGLTYKSRLQLFHRDVLPVHDYMDMFPALKSANGYLLVSMSMVILNISQKS